MNWFFGAGVYIIIWFLVLFTVLPWGVRTAEEPEPGHATSAPIRPRLGLKVLVTTVLAGLIWLAVDYVVSHNLVDFRQPESTAEP